MSDLDDAFIDGKASCKMVTCPAADTLLAAKNPKRIAIHFYNTGGTLNINNRPLAAATDGGLIATNTGGISITQRTHGDAASHEWHGWGTATTFTLVIEVFSCKCATGWGGE